MCTMITYLSIYSHYNLYTRLCCVKQSRIRVIVVKRDSNSIVCGGYGDVDDDDDENWKRVYWENLGHKFLSISTAHSTETAATAT